ncbi:hypothetical protein ACQZM9_21965 [Streptomyces sp. P11-1]|uniref:hypothetical protein n=1 Tax=Streptomyces sp. P11-1 TaxID=3423221 RepID=UPI003D2EB4F5
MRHTLMTPADLAVLAGIAIGAHLLTVQWVKRRHTPTAGQLTDAHRAGYTLALTHVSRGLLKAAPEEP